MEHIGKIRSPKGSGRNLSQNSKIYSWMKKFAIAKLVTVHTYGATVTEIILTDLLPISGRSGKIYRNESMETI